MKTTWLTIALTVIQLTAFAQGKVAFGNDASHLIIIDPEWAPDKGVPEYAGLPAPQMGTPKDVMGSLTAQLLAATTPDSLTLQSTLTPAGQAGLEDGRTRNVFVTLTGIGASVNAYFQIQIWETSYGSYANASAPDSGAWYASTAVFSGVTGDFFPAPLTSFSSWTPGPIMLTSSFVPESSTYALLALGVGSVLFLRRRKCRSVACTTASSFQPHE